MRAIVNNDELLEDGILPALAKYNVEQFMTVDVPGVDYQVRAGLPPIYDRKLTAITRLSLVKPEGCSRILKDL